MSYKRSASLFIFLHPFILCVLFHAVTARDGEDHEGVLVRQWSGQTDGPAHQEDPVSAQRGGGRQDVSGQAAQKGALGTNKPDHTPIGNKH